jgi:type VI secretion system protein ImpL
LTVKQALDQNLQPPASPVFLQVRSQAARLAEPVRSMVLGLSAEGESAAGSGTRRILGQELRSEIGEVCQRALNGRYPFAAGSPVDMALGDLQQIFGQGGMMDQFFKERLAPLVDTTGRVWRFREAGTATPVQSGALRQFQRAAEIRRAMFGGPGGTFGSVVHLTVVEMDPAILQFSLDVDGQVISYQHGPQIPTQVRWPGPRGSNQVRLEVSPPSASGVSAMTFDGPWALNRLFDQGRQVGRASPDRFRLAFNFGGRQVVLDVRASSVTNPFNLGELRSFRCPGLL